MMNSRENRMNALKNAGINTNNFFDLNLRLPFGTEVKLVVDGKEMIVGNNGFAPSVSTGGDVVSFNVNGHPIVNGSVNGNTITNGLVGVDLAHAIDLTAIDLSNDPIVQNIINSGYVFNAKTDGRWITAQTFKMLNERSYNRATRQWETGWDAYLRNRYPYMYQFDMTLDELHRLSRMERDNDPEFSRLSSFFTKDVVVELCKQYIRQLKKFVNNQPTRKHKGRPYVKLNRYGNVHKDELYVKVYGKLDSALKAIKNSGNYKMLEDSLKLFMSHMAKLPADTPKCSVWKDAFKGLGGFKSLNNIIKHHGVVVQNYETKEILDRDGSIAYVESLVDAYKGNYWKFHELLKATIELNNFDLRKSIEAQK